MRRTAARPLRSGAPGRSLVARQLRLGARIRCGAMRPCCPFNWNLDYLTGRRDDASLPAPPHGTSHRSARPAGQRRRPEPHRVFQSPRAFLRRLDVRGTRYRETRHPLGGQRRQRAGRLCRRRRDRSPYLHAAGCAAGQLHRMQSLRRPRHAGRRADQRLRQHRCRTQHRAKAGSTSRP